MRPLLPAAQRDWEATWSGITCAVACGVPLAGILFFVAPSLLLVIPLGVVCAAVWLLARPPMRYPAAGVLAPATAIASTASRPPAANQAVDLPPEFQDLPEKDEAAAAKERRRRKALGFDDPS